MTEYQKNIFLPNEIFNELKEDVDIKNSPHVAFSYSYIYLIHWLYRYSKYTNVDIKLDTTNIKKLLGYCSNSDSVNYLIKQNGLLENIRWIETTSDIPLSSRYEDGTIIFSRMSDYISKEEVTYISEYIYGKKEGSLGYSPNYKIKFPVRGFHRCHNEDEIDGVFYNIENTHLIQFDVFKYCMENTDVGCIGFYLYGFFKYKCQMFKDGYDCSVDKLSEDTGIKLRTLMRYLDVLKKYKMIVTRLNQDRFVIGMKDNRKANTYMINEIDEFTDVEEEYNRMSVTFVEKISI